MDIHSIEIAKYRPLDLDMDVEAKLDVSYHGTGYMTSDIFLAWLLAFDQDMAGRRIALLMDNAPGHGKEDLLDRHLRNITIIRLPKNTTSVSQPLDAGIIMSFKVKYGRLMIPIISHFRHQQNSANAKIPRGPLWACLPEAWDRVSTSTIRNCFARVPVLPDAMRESLKTAAIAANEAPDIELAELRVELVQVYPDLAPSIASQNDFGMLAFLKSMSRRGPTVHVDKFIDEIAALPKYKPFILPGPDPDDQEEDSNDDLSDYEYQPPLPRPPSTAVQEEVPPPLRTMNRRSGQYEMELPNDTPSSQDATSSQEVVPPEEATTTAGEVENTRKTMTTMLRHYCKEYDRNYKTLDDREKATVDRLEQTILLNLDIISDIVSCGPDNKL
jgi:hypothetical protein